MIKLISSLILLSTIVQTPPAQEMYLKNITVSAGTFKDKIVVEWKSENSTPFRVLRSTNNSTDFSEIGITDKQVFEDTAAEKGVVYWYRVAPVSEALTQNTETKINGAITSDKPAEKDQTEGTEEVVLIDEQEYIRLSCLPCAADGTAIVLNCYSGFMENGPPRGSILAELIKEKKALLKTPADSKAKAQMNIRLNYLKQYYMNPVKFSLMMTMAKPYLDKGELVVFSGKENFEINSKLKQFTFYDNEYSSFITFDSSKLMKIISKSKDSELAGILLKNSELFCVPGGKKIITDKAGLTRVVYCYDAVGLSTRYLKNDAEWRSRTIMLATSRADLKDKLKKASSPKVEEHD